MVLYAPFPNFIPISPMVKPGRGMWSSRLLSWTIKPEIHILIQLINTWWTLFRKGFRKNGLVLTMHSMFLTIGYKACINNSMCGNFTQSSRPPLQNRVK
jgi:hypothetical protein